MAFSSPAPSSAIAIPLVCTSESCVSAHELSLSPCNKFLFWGLNIGDDVVETAKVDNWKSFSMKRYRKMGSIRRETWGQERRLRCETRDHVSVVDGKGTDG